MTLPEKQIVWREDWSLSEDPFCVPDWEKIGAWADATFDASETQAAWTEFGDLWAQRLCPQVSEKHQVFESAHFFLCYGESRAGAREMLLFLEKTFDHVLSALPFASRGDELVGKCLILIMPDLDRYYRYLTCYDTNEEEETAGSGGVYLNRGYGHVVIPSESLEYSEIVLAHELSHALVAHLPMPLWLNEAVAQSVENAVTKVSPYVLDREMVERHQNYWDDERVQQFWSGESFGIPGDGQELSYHLARFLLVSILQGGREEVSEFISNASWKDAGSAAFEAQFGFPMGDLFSGLLGDGCWQPRLPLKQFDQDPLQPLPSFHLSRRNDHLLR